MIKEINSRFRKALFCMIVLFIFGVGKIHHNSGTESKYKNQVNGCIKNNYSQMKRYWI